MLEALQSNDWESVLSGDGQADDILGMVRDDDAGEEGDDEFDLENMDFGFDREDFEGLKKAIWEAQMEREGHKVAEETVPGKISSPSGGSADDAPDDVGGDDVEKVEKMMRKLQAVRDMSAGLPEEQRKRVAARAVGEVLRDL